MSVEVERRLSAIRKVMTDSLEKDFTPFPIKKKICSAWADDLPNGGKRILYTSFMYQLAGLFKSYEEHLASFARTGGSSKVASIGRFLMRPKKEDLQRAYSILRNISSILMRSGVEHGYLYEREPYSGGLLLELGMLDEFRDYGKKVLELFREEGVEELITVDPHTTNAMSRLVEMTDSDLKVTNYLTLISNTTGKGEYVLHDPCLYTRYSNLGGVMRNAVTESGVVLHEDRMVTSREYGTCCGGPLGPVDIGISESIAEKRAEKLRNVHPQVLVACPLCYQNLSPHVENIKDIAEVIS